MGERFDFRDLFGGAGCSVGHDANLADDVHKDEAAAELQARKAEQDEQRTTAIAVVVQFIANTIIANANARGMCSAGLLAMLVAAMGKAFGDGIGPAGRQHLIDEVDAMLSAMKRGEV